MNLSQSPKKVLSAVALATLALSLAACNKQGNTGAGSTLVIQESADIPTLDPGTSYDTGSGQVVENLYETLLTYKGNSLTELTPLLATEWTEGNDGREYRFTLREGVKFHAGNEFKCADAEYTFRRNLVTNTGESGNWFLSESLLGTGANANDDQSITWQRITDAVKCDGETLVFTLPKADPAFLAKLAYTGQGIVDSAHAREIGEWDGTEATWKAAVGKDLMGSPLAKDPSGTGAYRLNEKTATSLSATAFDDYWGDKARIKNVIIQLVPEQAARLQAFEKGDADIVETGGRPIIEEQLKGKPGIAILDNLPDTGAFGFSMNQNMKDATKIGSGKLDGQGIPANFFSDVDVRRGFVAAFNVPQYIKEVQAGKGEARNFLLPDTFPGYDKNLAAPKFDLDAARAAFQKAWNGEVWKNGFTLNATYRAGSVTAQTGMELLKQNIESLNPKFRMNIVAKQWSDILRDGNAGKELMIVTGWAPDYADPDNYVHTFYSSDGYYQPRLNLKDTQLDTWINEARSITDTERRNKLYSDIARRAADQAYYVLLPSNPGILAYRDTLKGVSNDAFNPMLAFRTGTLWKALSKG
ncbi:ABC transporter substrate-binding protein [Deinococcus aquatilis]|uniref:ABC transporter substrate-binding protein n=1 Tax=Deinococcus aquatilis TaxID=519440 RepID=UPI00037E018D|nr:ABC transporter substrate-binding protein [Deinococcus aquatilis]